MKSELTLIPTAIVNPSGIVIYNQIIWDPIKPSQKHQISQAEIAEENTARILNSSRKANGNVSKHAKRKMSKAIEYLVTTSYEKKVKEKVYGKTIIVKVAFITLTLPSAQTHTDSEIINRCLNSFLIEIRKFYNVNKYVWRAEKQQNGNIHFHILTDKFIPWNELRNRWNRIINKLGYVDRFQEKHGHRTPNSTDVHSTRKIKNLKSYLTKYLTKNENTTKENTNPEVETASKISKMETNYKSSTGRIWGCSHNLSKIQGFKSEIDSEISEELTKVVNQKEVRKYESTYFTVIILTITSLKNMGQINSLVTSQTTY